MRSHDRVAAEVEQMLADAAADDHLSDDARDRLLQMWRDTTDRLDVGRAKKAGTWAAGLFYAFDRIRFGGLTQQEAADLFGVSVPSVAAKFHAVSEALDLLLYDPRYTSEAERPAIFAQMDAMMSQLGEGPVDVGELPAELLQALLGGNAGAFGLGAGLADLLGDLAVLDDDEAEADARQAVEDARARLGTDDPDAFVWWGEIETRPYMRARAGLAMELSAQGRHREAAAEYEALLALNPNDNQGVRYLIGPEYLLDGDIEAATAAYAAYDAAYPDDSGDPDHAALRGLTMWRAGRREAAVHAWVDALAVNLYVIPGVLGAPPPPADLWFGSNLAWPSAADQHIALYGDLWDRWPDALDALDRVWNAPEVRARVGRAVEIGQGLHRLSEARRAGAEHDDARWRALVGERWALREPLPDKVARRIARVRR